MKNKKDTKQKKRIIASTGKGKKKAMKVKEKHYTSCRQTRCGYFINGGCQKCEECGAEPNKVEDRCQTCFDCENKPDALRWDNKGDNLELTNKDKKIMKEAFEKSWAQINKLSEEPKRKQLILNNGEIEKEKENNIFISKDNFEKELKQEILKHMVGQMIQGMSQGPFNQFKMGTEDNDKENKTETKKKNVSYIG